MRKVSVKRARQIRQYSRVRSEYLNGNPYCQRCGKMATDIHHKAGRSKKYLDVLTWLAVCRTCHQWIELHPKEAKELGYSISRIQDEDAD